MGQFIVTVLINAVALFIVSRLGLGLRINDLGLTLIAALVLGLLNAIARPVLQILLLPVTIITLGLFSLVINAFMFWLMGRIVGVPMSDWVLAWLAYSIIVWIISAIIR